MKPIKIRFYLYGISLIFIGNSHAQDFHYSQFDANPLYLNPALTGERLNEFKGFQFNANYRDQLARYTNGAGSYKSVAIGFDAPLGSKFSIGQFVANNKSIDGAFNTFNFMLSGAYKIIDKKVDERDLHNLSVGLQVGVLNKSIQPEKFSYDAQYSPTSQNGFDENLPSNESYLKQSFFKVDLNFGIYYRTTFENKKLTAFGGSSIYHITRPNESFIGDKTHVPLKFNLHGGVIYKLNQALNIMPQLLYVNQAKANELNLGALLFYKIKQTVYEPIIGLNWRYKNAIIPQLGIRAKGITVRMSYCIVINYLSDYNNRGLEFSIIYTANKKPSNGSVLLDSKF
jgi:type IX secretion system PorP/SprF family membrane protein